MASINEVAIKILVDGKEMTATLNEFDDILKQSGARGTQAGGKIKAGFGMAKIAIVATAGAIAGVMVGLNKVVNAASDFTEANSKMLTVFSKVQVGARAVRDELVSAYFMSTREATELLAATGDLLTGFGMQQEKALQLSGSVQRLAADIASFSNAEGGAEAVSSALTKALLGETESMKSYGVVINQQLIKEDLRQRGLDKLTGMALKQAQAESALNIAYKQSKNAVGDLDRTQNSYANTKRRVAAATEDLALKLGSVFMPIWNKVLSSVLRFVNWLNAQNISGILHASFTVISEFATRVFNLFEGVITALIGLSSRNFVQMKIGMEQVAKAIALGWDETIEKVKNSYVEGNIAFEEFLKGSVEANANANQQIAEDAQALTEKELAEIQKREDAWQESSRRSWEQRIEGRIRQYNYEKALRTKEEAEEKKRQEDHLKLVEQTKKRGMEISMNAIESIAKAAGADSETMKNIMRVRAIIDTYAGANRALATGIPPWSFITAAAVIVQGLANVATIGAQRFARGGLVASPTLGLVGEAGPEVIAPRKTFIDVQNEMIRRGEVGGGGEGGIGAKLDKLIAAVSGQILVAELSDDGLAIKVERGNQLLTERNY